MDAYQLWQTTLGQLQLQLARPTYDTWIKNTKGLSYEDGVLVVGVHSAYAKDWLENRLYATIQHTVTEIANRTTAVRFIVQRNGSATPQEDFELLQAQVPPAGDGLQAADERGYSRVNPKYTFSTFIVGQSNRLAHAGCLAVAENPGMAYNPLFIYGGAGLGKTHLLHAVGNYVLQRQDQRVLYVSAETFANELINAIRNRTTDDFRAKYRTIDVLLLDDVQFLINKERTQEEFFHTFNDLYQENRQIVLSSDRPPKAFVGLEERLRSRFEWGLSADVQSPDLETRMAILAAKAEARAIHLPPEVIEFIAQRVQSNIRELEGALTRVLALARMMDFPLTVQTAERALGDMARSTTRVTFDDIMNSVSEYYGVEHADLLGPRRSRDIALARQVVMYMTRELTDMSLPQIGQALGGRDHTTIMYGCDKISALFEKDDNMRRQILDIKTRLYGSESGVQVQEVVPQHV
ncbi:MAG TPA: chromosomal replication initiator protein DnaA [Chloroflexi bacterium]|jgi:chromosomal replication initiator protein|nr:chromosomal replication initiator protein DnaA [Chloroflexota bacterium]